MLIQERIILWGVRNTLRRLGRFGLIERRRIDEPAQEINLDAEQLQILQERVGDEFLEIPANVGDIIEPIMAFIPQTQVNFRIPLPGQPDFLLPPEGGSDGPELPLPGKERQHWSTTCDHGAQHPHGDPDAKRHGLSEHRVCFKIHDAEWVKANKGVPPEIDTFGEVHGKGSDFWNRLPDPPNPMKIDPETGEEWTEAAWLAWLLKENPEMMRDNWSEHLKIGAKGKGWQVCSCCACCPPIACDAYWYWERLEKPLQGGQWQPQTWPLCPPPAGNRCDFPLEQHIIRLQDLQVNPKLEQFFRAGDILPPEGMQLEFRAIDDLTLEDRVIISPDGPGGVMHHRGRPPRTGFLPEMPFTKGEDIRGMAQDPAIDLAEIGKLIRDLHQQWDNYNSSFSNIYIDLDRERPDLKLLGDFNNLDAPLNRQNYPLWPAGPVPFPAFGENPPFPQNKFISPFAGLILRYKPEDPNVIFRRLWNQEIESNKAIPVNPKQLNDMMAIARRVLEAMEWGGLLRHEPLEIDELLQIIKASWEAHFARDGLDDIPTGIPVIRTDRHQGNFGVRVDFDYGDPQADKNLVQVSPGNEAGRLNFCLIQPDWVSRFPEVNPAIDILSMAQDRTKKFVQDLEVGDKGNGWKVCESCPCPDEAGIEQPPEESNKDVFHRNMDYVQRWLKAGAKALIPQPVVGGDPGEPGEPGVKGENVLDKIKKEVQQPRPDRNEPNFPAPFGVPEDPEPMEPLAARKELDRVLKANPEDLKAAIKQIRKFVPDEMNAFLNQPKNKKFNP